ncbi:hypothetical protein QYF36_003381 [Acer negundo]|nr:hypothetical protein QYF36_003381 [Acer negundo]
MINPRRSKPTNSGNSNPHNRHYKEKQRSQQSRRSKSPPLGGQTSNQRPDRLAARRQLEFGTRPSNEALNPMAGEIQHLREDMDKFQLRRQRPRSYHILVDIAAEYVRVEEEDIAQGGTLVHGSYLDKDKVESRTKEREESRFQSEPRSDQDESSGRDPTKW